MTATLLSGALRKALFSEHFQQESLWIRASKPRPNHSLERIWRPSDLKDATIPIIAEPNRLMAGFAAKMGNIDCGDRIVGNGCDFRPWRERSQSRLETDHRQWASIAAKVEIDGVIVGIIHL